jgi:hypothetical protein
MFYKRACEIVKTKKDPLAKYLGDEKWLKHLLFHRWFIFQLWVHGYIGDLPMHIPIDFPWGVTIGLGVVLLMTLYIIVYILMLDNIEGQ